MQQVEEHRGAAKHHQRRDPAPMPVSLEQPEQSQRHADRWRYEQQRRRILGEIEKMVSV